MSRVECIPGGSPPSLPRVERVREREPPFDVVKRFHDDYRVSRLFLDAIRSASDHSRRLKQMGTWTYLGRSFVLTGVAARPLNTH